MSDHSDVAELRTHRVRAAFMRGGTSRAVMFLSRDLPADRGSWDNIFLQVMGSPDPYGRQLDGMGGGVSSLSKICVVGPSTRSDADVDYTFAQISVMEPIVDFSGNCGNMSAAVGPFAMEEGLVDMSQDGEAVVRIHNTNTGKIIISRFPVVDGVLAADGEIRIDGVAGTAAPIRLEFLEPGGAKTGQLLPTGTVQDLLTLPGREAMTVSCVAAATPCVFVAAADVGKTGVELPEELEQDPGFLTLMEQIRLSASVLMGIAPDRAAARQIPSLPKVAMVCVPKTSRTLNGETLSSEDLDIGVRMISMGQPHRAVPVTGAICLAVAARVPGTVASRCCGSLSGPLRIGHASGSIVVDAAVSLEGNRMMADFGAIYRTARRLFEGAVLYRSST